VQHHQRPVLPRELRKGGLDPALRVRPVARDRVPQHAGVAAGFEQRRRVRAQQPAVQVAAATGGSEQSV